jgi:ribonuclease BN (tRNA processing enzyme)
VETKQPGDTITFLGTGGARFMIISQLLASGGIWLSLSGTEILLDPGPGSVVQAAKRKLRGEKLSAIIVSHRHLDHTGDLNVMVEAMTQGGLRPHGVVFAPSDAWGPEPVMFSYLKKTVDETVVLKEGKSYQVGHVTFETPVRHVHPVETYGMIFKTKDHTFSYIADSRFFPGLVQHYRGDLLIINTVFLEPRVPGFQTILPVEHLSIPDAAYIITTLKPKVAILTHFGMNVWRAHPWEVAEQMTQKTGVRVIAARDGMKFDLATLSDGDTE